MFNQVMMLGGGKELKSVVRGGLGTNKLTMTALLVLFFVLKVLVVQWSYNKIAPKLISNMGNSTQQFKPLTFEESLLFTLLISFLF
tara:strand:+ start:276 stop:533 length:258 start_codon:yes stop_codon:yes gene_type:complete